MIKKNTEDIELINKILNGDRIAEEILYSKYKLIIKNYLDKNYPNPDIDDDVSEILIKVFLNLSKYDKEQLIFKKWVYSIAKNYEIDKWRKNDIKLLSYSSNNVNISSTNNYFDKVNNIYSLTSNINYDTINTVNFISIDLQFDYIGPYNKYLSIL